MNILDFLVTLLLLGWVAGFTLRIAGGFIHLLLIVAVVVFVIRMVTGRAAK